MRLFQTATAGWSHATIAAAAHLVVVVSGAVHIPRSHLWGPKRTDHQNQMSIPPTKLGTGTTNVCCALCTELLGYKYHHNAITPR